MTAPKKLRAVGPDEKPAKKSIPSLMDAITTGDPLTIALAQRRDIAVALPNEKGPAKAALHRQLQLISKEIELLKLAARQAADEDGADAPSQDEAWDEEAL